MVKAKDLVKEQQERKKQKERDIIETTTCKLPLIIVHVEDKEQKSDGCAAPRKAKLTTYNGIRTLSLVKFSSIFFTSTLSLYVSLTHQKRTKNHCSQSFSPKRNALLPRHRADDDDE